jgi:hypothetical protein
MSSLIYGAALLVVWGLGVAVYNLFFHPLRGIPGPFLAKISGWWLFALELTPTPHQELFRLHHKYGMQAIIQVRHGIALLSPYIRTYHENLPE